MPARYFAPKDGFADKRVAAVKVDTADGFSTSAQVLADGTERPTDSGTNHHRQSIPLWTEQELDRLVAGGSWKEIEAPQPAQAAGDTAKNLSAAADKLTQQAHETLRDEPAEPKAPRARPQRPEATEPPNA